MQGLADITSSSVFVTEGKFQKKPNCIIWSLIKRSLDNSNLTIISHKVKAHDGDLYNDRADKLAKLGAASSIDCSIDYQHARHPIPFQPLYFDLPIDKNVRSYVGDLQQAELFNRFLLMARSVIIGSLTAQNAIDWSSTWSVFTPPGSQLVTSFKNHHTKAFRLKLMFDTLPVLEHLKQRRPDLYSANLTCPLCNAPQAYESMNHLWTCNRFKPVTQRILNNFKSFIGKKITKKSPDAILTQLEDFDCWSLTNSATTIDAFYLIRGFLPVELITYITGFTKHRSVTNKILMKGLHSLHNELYTHIWKVRNELFIAFEQTLNITDLQKRSAITAGPFPPYHVRPQGVRYVSNPYTSNSCHKWLKSAIEFGFKWSDF